ncbi:type I restriction endonuclease subunit R [Cryobacterium tagatosivorans]|uniref:Type I restriction enzyme endonuclease subunit n=1 Tax=Cryobacterium tagatosivorans TaxID=1259199 RepID=A0A4R8UJK0_9MICO|nr:HsdR family type I site-specific deoxyribonuclease [Cryobacterium tagatosivorans]TFB56748.1 type I restriction endonuclease subunit R [Cryobacterium tagatosivorans]
MSDETFNATEKHQSQIPALQLLVGVGFTPLSQAQALVLRGDRKRNVLLEDLLAEKLLELNSFTYRGREYDFDLADAHEAIRKLKPSPDKVSGLQATSQQVYDTLVLGTTISKTIGGDSKSYSFRYIDWHKSANNVFHVTAEYSVERTGSTTTKRCDIVAFVNGIPFIVIENKRPTESIKKAGSQLIGYQDADNIPQLFHYAQVLLAMNRQEARYATVGTPRRFWHTWRDDEDIETTIAAAANRKLTDTEKDALFSGDFAPARPYFDALAAAGPRVISEQDRLLYALCRPERLLDLVRRFTVFDGGIRKIARHQQYFAVRSTVDRVAGLTPDGVRRGGVVWHTQGSGKSLTMVMLGKAIALDARIPNPRILIVTDRDDLDKQIAGTFRACDITPVRATSGSHLAQLLSARTPLITTIINKFDTATRRADLSDDDPNLFVLVDESHRSQSGKYGGHGTFAVAMRRMLPAACYLGFTGTPLLGSEKNTVASFGGLIHRYTIDQAVADGAVVPLLYEGRMVEQQVADDVIDRWFEKISDGLTLEQKADLKRKFSRADALSKAGQVVRAKAFDVSEHYRRHWQGTGFKAQLVAPDKASAIRFKEVLDEIGHVTSEVIISAPGEYEGTEQVDQESRDLVRRFWDRQIARFGGEAEYNRQIIESFKGADDPEILIVVSKLLTGFDAPRNTVLYLCKRLKEHTLLQAIARVNRLFEEDGTEKEFGIIIDYEGLLGELDKALTAYSALSGYDGDDLVGTVHDIREQIRLLPVRCADVWDVFKAVPNKLDMEALERHLVDEAVRQEFYARLAVYGKCLHIALSSDKLHEVIDDAQVRVYRNDWKHFSQLRRAVRVRYQEVVDLHDYEPRIQKLLDDHVTALPAEVIIGLVNVNDSDALRSVVEETGVSTASKADRIANATKKTITERMDEDPALYQRFSRMLQDTIDDYRASRLAERDYLQRILELAEQVGARKRDNTLPKSIEHDDDAAAIYGALDGLLVGANAEAAPLGHEALAQIAIEMLSIVREHLIVGIWSNGPAQNALLNALDDYCFDELEAKRHVDVPPELTDELQQRILSIGRARFPR